MKRAETHWMVPEAKSSILEIKRTFDKWLEGMQLSVNNQGNHFEHLMK